MERVLAAYYPSLNETALKCAKMFIAVALRQEVEMKWDEVRRLATLREYHNLNECEMLVQEIADELRIKNPLHSDQWNNKL
ncbi:MAG: hypothetical protein ACO1QB_05000 [Verrucomicrobiales bacterium]